MVKINLKTIKVAAMAGGFCIVSACPGQNIEEKKIGDCSNKEIANALIKRIEEMIKKEKNSKIKEKLEHFIINIKYMQI